MKDLKCSHCGAKVSEDDKYCNTLSCQRELNMEKLICPKCGSTELNTYRMPTGPIWCNKCNTPVIEKKEEYELVVESGEYYRRLRIRQTPPC